MSLGGTVKPNDDGSTTVYFGPGAPDGGQSNWVQTVPGKSWFTILRLYGPLQAWFDKGPGDLARSNPPPAGWSAARHHLERHRWPWVTRT